MPRYFIDTYDYIASIDEVGHDLPDARAALTLVRKSLAAMMRDLPEDWPIDQLRAEVRDEAGNPVLTGTLRMMVENTSAFETGIRE